MNEADTRAAVMWETVKLDEIVSLSMGKTPSRGNAKFWDKEKISKNIWLSIADLSALDGLYIEDSKEYVSDEGAKLFKTVPSETLVMSFKLSIGKLAITKCELRTNEAIVALPIKDEKLITKEYLYYFLSSINWDALAGNDVKVKGKTLNKAKLKEIPISYPPLAEQQRIVAKLDAAFAEIDTAIDIVEATNLQTFQLYQNELSKIFKNIDECEPRRTLKDAAKVFGRGKSKHRPRNDERLYGDKIPFIQTGNVSNAKMYVDSFDKCYSEFGISQSKIWEKGTVCITIAANIAELAILDMDACFPDSVIGLYPDKEITSSEYVFYLLSFFQIYIKSKSKGSAQQNINLATFESEKFPFPSNLANQNRIVDKLNKLQKKLGLYQSLQSEKLYEMSNLKASILLQELQSEAA